MCGMFQSNAKVIVSRLNVIQLLVHEVMCVFHDRLVNDLDRLTFCKSLSDVVYENFKVRWFLEFLKLTESDYEGTWELRRRCYALYILTTQLRLLHFTFV